MPFTFFWQRGNIYYSQGRYREALADYNEAINRDPGVKIYYQRGVVNCSLERYSESLIDFDKAVRLEPKSVAAPYAFNLMQGCIHHKAELYEEAIDSYNKAIKYMRRAIVYFNRAIANYCLNRLSEALRDLNKAARLEPRYADDDFYRSVIEGTDSIAMYQIAKIVHGIEDSLEKLVETLCQKTTGSIDLEYISGEITDISNDMLALKGIIVKSSEKFGYEFDSQSFFYLEECMKELTEASERSSINTLKVVRDKILYAHSLWKKEYSGAFKLWCDNLMSSGIYLCRNAFVYDEYHVKEAFLRMLQNALCAEKLFFSLARNKNKAALIPIKDDLVFNRRTEGQTRPIRAHHLSGRRLIMLNIASIEEAMVDIKPDQLTSVASIAQSLRWHKTGKNWNRETVIRGYLEYNRKSPKELEIKYQFQPIPGQLANIRTSGVACYGMGFSKKKLPNVLEVINRLTDKDQKKESALARLLLRYKRGELALNKENLKKAGMNLPNNIGPCRKLIKEFNAIAYLICFQEVYRRKNQGYYKKGQEDIKKVTELPFGIAIACILKLIADEHLSANVFDKNSSYGVFTGTSVMNKNFLSTLKKFNELFASFVEKYANKDVCLVEYSKNMEKFNIAFTPEFFHEILKETDGDENDSDGEDYEPSYDGKEFEEIRQLSETLKNLELKPSQFRY
jgi:lipoprotein NlpI